MISKQDYLMRLIEFLVEADLETEFLNKEISMFGMKNGDIYFNINSIKTIFWVQNKLTTEKFAKYLKEIMESLPERPDDAISVFLVYSNDEAAQFLFKLEGKLA